MKRVGRQSSLPGSFVDGFDSSQNAQGPIAGKAGLRSVGQMDYPPPTVSDQGDAKLDAFVLHA
jgi:hypothetical protein